MRKHEFLLKSFSLNCFVFCQFLVLVAAFLLCSSEEFWTGSKVQKTSKNALENLKIGVILAGKISKFGVTRRVLFT